MRVLSALVLLAGLAISLSCLAGNEPYALYADFDTKTANQPLGTRGASYGEPVSVGSLDATIVQVAPGEQVLRISNDLTSSSARRLRWTMTGDALLNSGTVVISFLFTPGALDRYSIRVTGNDTPLNAFLSLTMTPTGSLHVADHDNAVIATFADAYSAGSTSEFKLVFYMDARQSSVYLDGAPLVEDHAMAPGSHGIARLYTGYNSLSAGNYFDLDELVVVAPLPFPVVLDADFEAKNADVPIGLGGAAQHEPWFVSKDIDAIVRKPHSSNLWLEMTSNDTARADRVGWHFLHELEIRTGIVILDFEVMMGKPGDYWFGVREPFVLAQSFTTISHTINGNIIVDDHSGSFFLFGTGYSPGQLYHWQLVFDLDAGIYSLYRDGIPLLLERAHGVTARGLGQFVTTIQHGTDTAANLIIDSLRVSASDAELISADIEFLTEADSASTGQAVRPVIEVGVLNAFDERAPDGTTVTLSIAPGTGPAGATLANATAATQNGVAAFPDLSFSRPGIYRLQAQSMDVLATGNVDVLVTPHDRIFASGFEPPL